MPSRYRTPLCVLFSTRIIAASCFILAQRLSDGPNSLSLDARTSYTAPSASLPTPPTHKPSSPERSRFALQHFGLTESELLELSGTFISFPLFAGLIVRIRMPENPFGVLQRARHVHISLFDKSVTSKLPFSLPAQRFILF